MKEGNPCGLMAYGWERAEFMRRQNDRNEVKSQTAGPEREAPEYYTTLTFYTYSC
jgi:hypothetical protein